MKEDIALGILVLGESAHFFSAFNPSIFTIQQAKKSRPNPINTQ